MTLRKKLFFILSFSFVLIIKLYFLITSFCNADFTASHVNNNGDSSHYLSIAKNIYKFHTYADNGSYIANEYATWRAPIWPFVLSFLFYISNSTFWLLLSKIVLETILLTTFLNIYRKRQKLDFTLFVPFLILFIEPQYLKYSFSFISESFNALLILLLTVLFLTLKTTSKFNLAIPILSAIIILCHPVSTFFILTFMGLYCLLNVKKNSKTMVLHGFIFIALLLIWPIRNALTFDKGLYLTASQGATFSKGWNEEVLTNFTNVEGDLANEGLNLKFIKDVDKKLPVNSVLDLSKLYQQGTWNYINQLNFIEKVQIAFKKIKSNFNPFPEKPKPGFFEDLSIVFRILYLVLFLQLIKRLFQFKKFDFESQKDRVFLIVLAVLIGQIIMSIYIYTGYRFNSIYSLCLLFCFIIVNQNLIQKTIHKLF